MDKADQLKIVRSLTPRQAKVIELYYSDGYTFEEIAHFLSDDEHVISWRKIQRSHDLAIKKIGFTPEKYWEDDAGQPVEGPIVTCVGREIEDFPDDCTHF